MKHLLEPGTPCYNCATPLVGQWCHNCGQAPHDFHRSAWLLASEVFENFFHADSRLWRTLWRLLSNPARLTRDYLAGKRAPQIPPLRLFLVVLLLVFLIGGWATRGLSLARLEHQPADVHNPVAGGAGQAADGKATREHGGDAATDPASSLQKAIDTSSIDLGISPAWNTAIAQWLRTHLSLALARPDDLVAAMRDRAENYAFLMLPISALLLAAIFVLRRGFVLFDHLIFSMHSLSFQGLLISLAVLTNLAWLMWIAPVHLFAHLRGVYGTGVAGTLVRMLALFLLSAAAFSLLLLALVVAGLRVLHA